VQGLGERLGAERAANLLLGRGAVGRRSLAGDASGRADHGFHLLESPDWSGLVAAYRWFVHDPIRFTRSLRWTVEHGHANNFANAYASVAYWYQTEPHAAFPALPDRVALRPSLPAIYDEARDAFFAAVFQAIGARSAEAVHQVAAIGVPFYAGRFAEALARLPARA